MERILFFLTFLTLSACNTFEIPETNGTVDVSVEKKTMDQLNIPSTFTFKTSQDITVTITANDNTGARLKNVPFKLYSIEKGSTDSLLLMSGQTESDGTFLTKLNVTANIDRLVVLTDYVGLPSYNSINVNSNSVSFTLGNDNLKRKGLVSEDKFSGKGGGGDAIDATFTYMGSYNTLGVPLYLLPQGDVVSQDILNMINASLPEGRPVPQYNSQYIATTTQTNIVLKDSAAVWVTFVHEGAGYRNTLGYYTYPTNNPPTTAAAISQLKIVFPNVSYLNSGGGLKTGDKVYLGNFSAGTTIGWFLVPDGWTTPQNTVVEKNYNSLYMRYSNREFNTFTSSAYRSHVALLADPARELFLLGFEDLNRPSGDNDFNDAVFYVTSNPFTAVDTTRMVKTKPYGVDSDGDGVPDSQDAAPADPAYAFVTLGPAANQYGSIAFEDAFPYKGDYDMNDMIVDYNIEERRNAANKVTQLRGKFVLKAMGASYRNGFGIELPISPTKVASATGMKIRGNIINLSPNGTEAGQNKATFILFDNGYSIMPTSTGEFLNTQKDKTFRGYDTIQLAINFVEPLDRSLLGSAPYNPFIFVNQDRGREVHLPGKPPTTLANPSYFLTGDDDSRNGKYYQTAKYLPWAIHTPQSFIYPSEKMPINTAFLKFNQWAESNGAQYIDWYQSKTNYRDSQKIY